MCGIADSDSRTEVEAFETVESCFVLQIVIHTHSCQVTRQAGVLRSKAIETPNSYARPSVTGLWRLNKLKCDCRLDNHTLERTLLTGELVRVLS
jgi:hypothetical protein